MKRPTMLVLGALLQDAALYLDLSVERDVQTIERRFKHEGMSFLTITLPTLSDALERGIESGLFSCPTSFRSHGSLPVLLRGFFKRVFDKDGRLLQDACPDSVFWIRQVCRFFKKQKISCSPARERDAIAHYLEVERELRHGTLSVERKDDVLDKVSGIIWSRVFPEIDVLDLVCHHGPGVTADRYLSNERYRISKWDDRSELTFPSDLLCYPNYGVAAEAGTQRRGNGCAEGIEYLAVKDECPVRVVFVPKTQTSPRVIAIEPSHKMYMQQAIKDLMYTSIESHSLTKHSIRFTRQDVNQRLAYIGSIDRRTSTLDLKDASDRVHLHLVQRIFKTSGLLEFLEDARSLHANLPDETNIVLFKYASQGSALCFPVEACVFYTLIQAAMHRQDGWRPSSRSVARYGKLIDIYGDDIIVPVEYTDEVVSYLESYLLKVNVNKSFRFSNFRESCGADFYKGVPVNPVYARKELPDNLRHWDADQIVSWNETADLLYMRGLWTCAQTIRDLLRRVARRPIPRSREPGSGLYHFSLLFSDYLHWNAGLQGWRQKRIHFQPTKKKDEIDGDEIACLNRWGLHTTIRERKRSRLRGNIGTHRSMGARIPFGIRESMARMGQTVLSTSNTLYKGMGEDSHVDARTGPSEDCVRTRQACVFTEGRDPFDGLQDLEEIRSQLREDEVRSRPGALSLADYCLQLEGLDRMDYLIGDSSGLDFQTSTKRGCFKSKSRWVSLAG